MVRPISSQEIRKAFLDFFARNGHLLTPSSSLVPKGDPTLLFTSAGMVQFKPYFSGEKIPTHRRLASCQKCFRTTDIDRVGDESHLTFFEMLGNFSIGDYFKEGAIELAWEFVTRDLGLPPDRLWITIYLDDDEARDLWMKIGVPEARILRFGKSENWWGPAGETGPCGPDSEIFYDRGEKYGCGRPDCGPNCPYCDRYLELWNLVFMQYHQDEAGGLTPLPEQNIDTGMGLERAAVVMQEASSVYETDLFYPLVKRAAELVGVEYGSREASDRSLRIIAEHGRAATFLLSDGVMPANEGRGYVLRRILRKAIYHGRHLGQKEPFLGEIAGVVSDLMGEAYPELIDRAEFVVQVMTAEEERFHQTLDTGTHLLLALLEDPEVIERGVISGLDVFRLYDTYGLPPDFTREIAAERGIDIDEEGFEAAMAEQRERARAAQMVSPRGISSEEAFGIPTVTVQPAFQTEFVGYDSLESTTSKVVEVLQEGSVVDVVEAGKDVEIVLDKSPFYAEAGGQVGDTGYLRGPNGCVRVLDTQWVQPEFFVHRGVLEEGHLKVGEEVVAEVDKGRRLDIMRNHTATHLLHKALREVLGGHASQSGSLVAPDRLRFDFTHMAALTTEELREIERRINAKIRENLPVTAQVISYDEAIAAGAVAIFGEKYGDRVRMVSIDDYTKELCAGTHLRATGEIGLFHIVGEESVGAGLRRIEALTGRGAERYMQEALATLAQMADRLQVPPMEVGDKVASLLESLREKEREVVRLRRERARSKVDSLLEKVAEVKGVKLLAAEVQADDIESLREMTDWVRGRLGSVVVVLGAVLDGKPGFVAAVTPDLVERGLRADWLVKEVANLVGGGGGGRATLAQAGGREASKLQEALAAVEGFLAERLKE